MKRLVLQLAVAFAVISSLSLPSIAAADPDTCWNVQVLNVNQNLPTSWWGANDKGQFSGNFCPAANCVPFVVEGVLYDSRKGTFETFTGPSPYDYVAPFDINNAGLVVGSLQTISPSTAAAFTRTAKGVLQLMPKPTAATTNSLARGVNNWGAIVGSFTEPSVPQRGFIYANGTFTLVDLGYSTIVDDINDWGAITGYVQDATGGRTAFVKPPNGPAVIFSYPGAWRTEARAINNRGEVAGFYTMAPGVPSQNFIYDGSSFSAIPVPGATDTQAWGISTSGYVAGTHNGTFEGFIARIDHSCGGGAPDGD